MTRFFEQLNDEEKEKYIKDLKKNIDLETYPKIKDFILNNTLYITNVKLNPINLDSKDAMLILDNSQNKWFILCIDGKITLIAKKNVVIHTDNFKYENRDASFNKKYKIKKVDYLIEYVENIGANLSLNIKNYNDKIGKNKWCEDDMEIANMTIHSQKDITLNGYTYNGTDFSLCTIGKNYDKQKDLLA